MTIYYPDTGYKTRVDVDSAGTGVTGLELALQFSKP